MNNLITRRGGELGLYQERFTRLCGKEIQGNWANGEARSGGKGKIEGDLAE